MFASDHRHGPLSGISFNVRVAGAFVGGSLDGSLDQEALALRPTIARIVWRSGNYEDAAAYLRNYEGADEADGSDEAEEVVAESDEACFGWIKCPQSFTPWTTNFVGDAPLDPTNPSLAELAEDLDMTVPSPSELAAALDTTTTST